MFPIFIVWKFDLLNYVIQNGSSRMKTPNFENCQIWLCPKGKITRISESFSSWVGKSMRELTGSSFRSLMVSLNPSWGKLLHSNFHKTELECFLPFSSLQNQSSFGVQLTSMGTGEVSVVCLSPALAPHESLKKAFLGDLMKDPRALANTLIRLQKAESRLADYVSNFPGIFFTQRTDLTFSYLSKGIQKLFPSQYREFSRNGGLFVDKIFEQDREHFHHMLSSNSKRAETFSFSYRVELPPAGQLIYLLDVRTPILTATDRLLGFDGVFIDITRQAIAEHRISNTVWREGLATLTNGLVHDFSNLMAGIYSISELYHGMMEKDDPMANGMGQIRKSTMQAQKLVRRIIDLHRQKPASRAIHDIRLLLKDQMDLIQIIIPRSAKITTDFGKEPLPAFLEETGFRQVVLNLAINSRDAISRNGKIKISAKIIKKGSKIMKNAWGGSRNAKFDGTEISFSDDGGGIAEEIAEFLFDPFFTTKESSSGSGFGLYNSKLFMEDHNGEIGFSSTLGQGTTFYLFLPFAELNEKKEGVSKTAKRASREFTKKRKIGK
mgnify:FL=1